MRDRVRIYNGGIARTNPLSAKDTGIDAQYYVDTVSRMKDSKEKLTIIKMAIGFHSSMGSKAPNFFYGDPAGPNNQPHANRGPLTEQGLKRIVSCVEAMKKVLGDEIGLALDCGPGFMLSDAIRLVGLESKHLVYSRKQSFFFFQFIAMPSGRLRSSEHSGMELLRRSSRAVLLCSNSSSSISSSSVGSSSVVANHSGSS